MLTSVRRWWLRLTEPWVVVGAWKVCVMVDPLTYGFAPCLRKATVTLEIRHLHADHRCRLQYLDTGEIESYPLQQLVQEHPEAVEVCRNWTLPMVRYGARYHKEEAVSA